MELSTVMRFASMSKLLTAIAGLKCVEDGLIGLDDDVTKVLPTLGDLQILTGFNDDNTPILKPPTQHITLR
jgi:CubicO group peptidase (beta-lactamase class C family)